MSCGLSVSTAQQNSKRALTTTPRCVEYRAKKPALSAQCWFSIRTTNVYCERLKEVWFSTHPTLFHSSRVLNRGSKASR